MPTQTLRIASRDRGTFDAHLAIPEGTARVPGIVIASSVFGVNADVRGIAAEFAAKGYLALAPDLFWRTVPGPLRREVKEEADQAIARSQPRMEKLKTGEADLADALAELRRHPRSNGRVAVIGLCYGGPYAVIGPKRLGYDAGVSCHGTDMLPFLEEMAGSTRPVQVIWGDQDHAAPPPVIEAWRKAAASMPNLKVDIFPGRLHGYMMRENAKAFDAEAYSFSMARACDLLAALRS